MSKKKVCARKRFNTKGHAETAMRAMNSKVSANSPYRVYVETCSKCNGYHLAVVK